MESAAGTESAAGAESAAGMVENPAFGRVNAGSEIAYRWWVPTTEVTVSV